MESQTSLDYLIETEDFLGKFAKALEKDDDTRKHTFEILAALCVYSKEGYNRAVGVLEHHKNTKKKKYRFSLVVDELRATDNVHYKIILLEFINCLIIYTDKAENRIRIRNEFFSLKLQEILNSLKSEEEQHIVLQLQVFEDHKFNDEEQFAGVKGIDLNSALDIFNAIFKQVSDSPLELYFLTCLQYFLKIDNKDALADKIWQTAEQLLSKCTSIESAEDAQKLLVTTSRRLDKQGDGKCCCSCHKDCGERGQNGPKVPSGNIKDTPIPAVPAPPPPPPPPGAGPPPPPPPPGAGPPPPPPPPGAAGAPPPPPFGGFASPAASKALPQQITPKPKAKMRSLQWQKIPNVKVIGKNNLWTLVGKIFSYHKVDYSKMDDLFSVNPMPQTATAESSTPGTDKKKKENSEVTLIESRRSLNVNIFLKQFRMPHDEIVRLLREGNSSKFGAEKLRGLSKLLPTHDEVDIIKAYDGNKDKLGEAEKFFVCLMGLPNYTLRIEGLLIKEEFNDNMEWIRPSIESVIQAAKDIKDNQSLRELIYLVLIAGNYLNSGNYAGNAAGFKLSSLVKLTEIRANKPRMNLMHYVVMEALEKNPRLLSFPDEMKALKDASQTSVDSLSSDILTLANKVSTITEHINRMNDNFRGQMEPFLKEANYEMLELKEDLKDIDVLKTDLAEFFCEDANAFKLEECFKTLSIFCERFKKAVEENKLRKIQEEKAKARRKQKENDHSTRKDAKEPNDQSMDRVVNDDGSIVDMLLADVRSGFASRPLGDNNFTVTKVKKVTLDSLNNNGSLQTGVGEATSKPDTPEVDPNDFVRLGFGRTSMRRRRLPNARPTDSTTMDNTDTDSTCSSLEDANDTMTTKRTRRSYATFEDDSLIDFLMQSGDEPDTTPFDKNGSMRRRRKERLERRGLLDVFSERERAPSPALSDQSCDKSQSISDSPLSLPDRPKSDVVDKHPSAHSSPLRRTRSMVDKSAVDRALARAQDFDPKKSLEESDHEQFLSRMKQKLHNKNNDDSESNKSVISDLDSPVKVTVESPTDVRPRNRWRSSITNVIPESPRTLETISEKDKPENSANEDKNNNVKAVSAITRSREQFSSRFRNTLDSAELSKMMKDVDSETNEVNVSINEKLNRAYNLQEDLKKVETGEKALGSENVSNSPRSRPETPVDINEENLKKKRERRKMRSQLSMEEVHAALKPEDKPELSNESPKSPVVPPRRSRASNSDLNKSDNNSGPNSPTEEKHILSKAAKLAGKKKFRQDRFGGKDTSGSDSSVNRCKSNVEIDNVDKALRDYVSQGNMSRSKSYDESVAKQALDENEVHLRGSGSTPDTCSEKQAIRRSTGRLSSCDDRRYGRIFDSDESKSNSVGQLSQGSSSPKSQSRLSIRSTNTSTETITANQSDGDKSPETRRKNSANSQGNNSSPNARKPTNTTNEQFTPKQDWVSNITNDDSDDPYFSVAKWKQTRRSLRVSHGDYQDIRSKSIFGRGEMAYITSLKSDPNEVKNDIGSRSSYASSQDEGFESMSGASGSQRASMASTLDSNETNIIPRVPYPLATEIIEEDKKQRTASWTASTLHASVSHNNSLDSAVDFSPASPISSHEDQKDDIWTANLNDTVRSNTSVNESPKTSTPKTPPNSSKTTSKTTRSTPSYMRGTHSSVTKTPPTTESRFDRNKTVRASMRVEQTLRRSAAAQSSNLSKSKTQTGSNTSLTGSNSSDISSSTAHSKASTIRRRLTTTSTSRPTTPSSRPTTPSARPTTPSARSTTPSTRTTTRTPSTPTKQTTPSKPTSSTKVSPSPTSTPSKPFSRTQSMRVTSTRKSIVSPTTEGSRSKTPSFMEPTASYRAARKELPQVPTPESTPKARVTSSASGIKPAGSFTPSPLTRHGSMRRSTKSPAPAAPTIEDLKSDKGKLSPAKKVINKVSRQLPTVSETRGSFRRSGVTTSAK